MVLRFDWDPDKNFANQRKHGLSFEKVEQLLFSDADYLELYDEAHSDTEDRFIAVGVIDRCVVVVVWTEPEDDTVRIIGARWATSRERVLYHRFMDERR